MKKITSKLMSTVCLLTAGVLCQTTFAAATLTEGELVIGMEITYPPFESYDGDKVVGFDPELTALLSEKMNVTPSFSDNKFTGLILGLSANKFDAVISGMYIKEERLKKADAVPYARTGAAIMVPKGSAIQPRTDKDLCGVKVGLQQGTSWVKAFKELSDTYCVPNGMKPVYVQEFPSAPEATQAMLSRNIDAQVEIAGAANMFVKRTKGRIQISSDDLIYPSTLGIYVKKGNLKLKAAFEKAMAEIKADGSYAKLLEKYELSPVK
ncbi:ABC transporter substrate-binding protein [Marinomonas aquiplantarum]|uniref:Amino acid ABC transporter substrate-binding protein (PAAT family) n=1 Tax=Marinomonas aquiplantarum TaxID=491951 RepID=A0A366CYX3_9GAMM|nr:ABC transporter substrate-binding protein [Marinomonas aquiplantarum]RBO82188.1 amino acid ABC transporter substrate-binding protein (PAAT family) [Marinomonas aquiplantarum]